MRYEIVGEPLPVVICHLDAGESVITEKGSMSWMSPNMKMETKAGGLGKAMGRMFSGESMFQNIYTAENSEGMIAFASSFPGTIMAFNIAPSQEIIAQKSAFLASESTVTLSAHIQKKLGAGFFGGEGFIMQRLSGNGIAFVEIDGYCSRYELAAGEKLLVDTGYLAAMSSTVSLDIQSVAGLKNKLFGGEGFFNTVLTGPGSVWIQSMPISNIAGAISRFIPSK